MRRGTTRTFSRQMLARAILIWVIGLLTIVPYGTYYLFFEAPRDQYAILITLVLFWIFGYWGVVAPMLAALKARAVFRALEQAQSEGRLREALRAHETREVVVGLIASENHIPRFLAALVYRLLMKRLCAVEGSRGATLKGADPGGSRP